MLKEWFLVKMYDIVFPNKNEQEFIKIAEKLRYKGLVFVYSLQDCKERKFDTKLNIQFGIICKEKEVQKARNKTNLIIVKANNDENREIIERYKPDIVFDFEDIQRKDFMHSRNSGLNHVLCNLMNKNKIAVGFSFESILTSKKRQVFQGRIKQNTRLCRKYKVKTIIASFAVNSYHLRGHKDLISYFTELGMHPKEAKDSFLEVIEIIKRNEKKKGKDYVMEGVEVVE